METIKVSLQSRAGKSWNDLSGSRLIACDHELRLVDTVRTVNNRIINILDNSDEVLASNDFRLS